MNPALVKSYKRPLHRIKFPNQLNDTVKNVNWTNRKGRNSPFKKEE